MNDDFDPVCTRCGGQYQLVRIFVWHLHCGSCDYWPDFPKYGRNRNPEPDPPLTMNEQDDDMRIPFGQWFTGDQSLTSPDAAHETAAVLRMHRQGWSSAQICKALGLSPQGLKLAIELALDEEGEAHRLGLPIYDGQKSKPDEGEK